MRGAWCVFGTKTNRWRDQETGLRAFDVWRLASGVWRLGFFDAPRKTHHAPRHHPLRVMTYLSLFHQIPP
jgi:hypothetical protein